MWHEVLKRVQDDNWVEGDNWAQGDSITSPKDFDIFFDEVITGDCSSLMIKNLIMKRQDPLHIVVLAAGQGTRMKSTLPKILHPLGGRPVLHYVLDVSHHMNPQDVILVVSPELKDIETPFDHTTIVQHPALGTGDAVRCALSHLNARGHAKGHVLVLYGDTPLIQKETLMRMMALSHSQPEVAVILLGMRPGSPEGYGRLIVNETGGLEDIIEQKDLTPAQQEISLCNSGVMLIRADLLPSLLAGLTPHNAANEYYLPDVVKGARKMGYDCAVVEGEVDEFMGINTRQDLAKAEAALQMRWRDHALSAGVTLKDPQHVYLSFDTRLSPDVTLHPFVILRPGVTIESGAEVFSFCQLSDTHVGPHARIGPFAHLRGGVELQEKAEIGNFVEVKKSTFGVRAKAKHLSYIGDTHVGNQANIGAGTITCNYDGFRKSKTHIGQGVFIGSNSSLIAPLSIGDFAMVAAGSVITQDVESGDLAVAREKQTVIAKGADRFRRKHQKEKDYS